MFQRKAESEIDIRRREAGRRIEGNQQWVCEVHHFLEKHWVFVREVVSGEQATRTRMVGSKVSNVPSRSM